MSETKEFRGTLESVNKAETGQNKPYLKIKAIPDGLEKARTYNYHAPWKFKDDVMGAKAHIEETRQGLLPLTDADISFTFVENPNPNGDFPFKNIKEFPADFTPAAEPKQPVVDEEHVKDEEPASTRPNKQEAVEIRLAGDLGVRKVVLKVGLAKTINLGDHSFVRPEFSIEEVIKGTDGEIEMIKDEILDKFRLWIDAEEAKHR